jgi:hypothetical protein
MDVHLPDGRLTPDRLRKMSIRKDFFAASVKQFTLDRHKVRELIILSSVGTSWKRGGFGMALALKNRADGIKARSARLASGTKRLLAERGRPTGAPDRHRKTTAQPRRGYPGILLLNNRANGPRNHRCSVCLSGSPISCCARRQQVSARRSHHCRTDGNRLLTNLGNSD